MSTLYIVEISSPDETAAKLKIEISIIPGQSTWSTEASGIFSIDDGPMLNDFKLMGLGVTPVAFLTGFPGSQEGVGGKNDIGGSFPQGEFSWRKI